MRNETRYTNMQVIAGVLLFLAIMGIVGKMDFDSQQAILDEKINIRDSIKTAYEADDRRWTAFYEARIK